MTPYARIFHTTNLTYSPTISCDPKKHFRLAQTLGYSPNLGRSNAAWLTEVNWIFGKKKHHFTTGLAYTVEIQNDLFSSYYEDEQFVFVNLGYRLQDFSKDGLSFSVRLNPYYNNGYGNNIGVHGGVSLGYSF